MNAFYDNQKYLTFVDATPLLEVCIHEKYEQRKYLGTCHETGTALRPGNMLFSPYEITTYERDYISTYITEIDTKLLIDKLDASLYYWRELNPQLYALLSRYATQEIEMISNWVKMIHYLQPVELHVEKFKLISSKKGPTI